MIVKVKDDNGHTIGKHHPKTFQEFEEIAFSYREKFN